MKVLKKYFKIPPKETLIIYGAGAAFLLALFLILYFTVGKTLTAFVSDTQSFDAWLKSYNHFAAALFVFIRAFQTVIKIIPAEPLEIASGYAFGTFGGLLYCSLGTFIGSVIIYALSWCLGKKFVSLFVNEAEFKKLSLVTDGKNRRLFLTVFYLIPGTPKDIFTYIAGAAKMNFAEFFLITTFARIPSIITSTICGAQLGQKNYAAAVAVFVATAIVSAACAVIYKKHSEVKKYDSFKSINGG